MKYLPALMIGVYPSSSLALTSAPFSRSKLTTSVCPFSAAKDKKRKSHTNTEHENKKRKVQMKHFHGHYIKGFHSFDLVQY